MIHWHLIHATQRKSDTLQPAMASWHAAGIERVVIHPDNGTLGAMHNMERALRAAIAESKDWDRLCVLQDDMILCRDALLRLSKTEGCAVLFTPAQNVREKHREARAWVPLVPSWNTWGGLVVLPRDVAIRMVEHPFWRRHLLTMTERRQTDACTFGTLGEMGESVWHHVPSLADHIGMESTIGNEHGPETQGFRFNEWGG